MLTIRPETLEDRVAIRQVNQEAFGQKVEADIVEKLRERGVLSLSLVAVQDDVVIGHIAFSPVEITSESSSFEALALAPMAVHPDFQNKGIGSKLVLEGLKKAMEFGYTSVIVVGHPNYYPRFGFKPASIWEIRLPLKVPDEAVMALELKPDSLKNCRGIVEYPKEYRDY